MHRFKAVHFFFIIILLNMFFALCALFDMEKYISIFTLCMISGRWRHSTRNGFYGRRTSNKIILVYLYQHRVKYNLIGLNSYKFSLS